MSTSAPTAAPSRSPPDSSSWCWPPDFYLPLRELGTHYHARAEAAGAAEEIMQVLQAPATMPPATKTDTRLAPPIEIAFEQVCFGFEDSTTEVLRNVHFRVRPGEKITLAGASGEGKSSLLSLLMGFYRPTGGTITINGRPLEALSLRHWRRQLAWVAQQPVLFHGSLRDNIRLGRPEADESTIQAAAQAAKVLEFADRMPRGLDTQVGEKGHRLSRGQAQRVTLARAFLADRPVLLLDEPTAGLDSLNERLVVAAIETVGRGRTVIMVTHRMAHVRDADRVLTMQNGTIAEDGHYRDLIAARGPLFQLLQPPREVDDHA